jgi:translation initiation factor 1
MQKKTNANPPAISSARASRANTPAAAVSSLSASRTNTADVAPPEFEPKVSPPPPFASDRWAAGGASSSDEEEDVKKTTTKKGASKRAPPKKSSKPKGKDKYLAAPAESDPEFMSGTPGFDDDALPPTTFDPFADEAAEAGAAAGAGDDGRVHLRVQQRNGRKTLTTVQGLSKGYNYAKVLRDLKRELCCNGTVVEDKELANDIQLQGDHHKKVAAFIAKAGLAKTDCIKVHGF